MPLRSATVPPRNADAVRAKPAGPLAELSCGKRRATIRRRLVAWYDRAARDLPWRRSRDAYRVWVSEIMLQQTVVAAVVPKFEQFVSRFPTVNVLASSAEDDVLRHWEGLGYYRRARQLYRAAQIIRDEHGGEFPSDAAVVRALPGIGRYTAGAILSIAFDQPQPILEANTIRLLARLLAYRGETTTSQGQAVLWNAAELLVPRRAPGTFNQALMELGSRICTPKSPRCEICPLAALCPTRAQGLIDQIPQAKSRPQFEAERHAAVIVRRGARVLLVRRELHERWAGLWDFPRFSLATPAAQEVTEEITRKVAEQTGWKVVPGRLVTTLRHTVTRYKITLDCYEATCPARATRLPNDRTVRWVDASELAETPLNTTGRKLARMITSHATSAPLGK